MKALLITVNFRTGQRANGKLNVKNNVNLPAIWQDLIHGLEVRLIVNSDSTPFTGIEGVSILDGEAAISEALDTFDDIIIYKADSDSLIAASISSKNINTSDIEANLSYQEQLEMLYNKGALGISRIIKSPAPIAELKTWLSAT